MSTSNHSHSNSQSVHRSTHKKPSAASSSLDAIAAVSLKLLSEIETELGLDDASPRIDPKTVRAVSRVSADALTIAAGIVSSDPRRFPDFDASVIGDAAEYARVITPVLERAEALVRDLQKNLYERRQPGAQQTRALYATLQGLARLADDAPLKGQVDKLSAALVPQRKTRKLTAEQKMERKIARNKAKRADRLKSRLAALEPTPAPVTVSGTNNAH